MNEVKEFLKEKLINEYGKQTCEEITNAYLNNRYTTLRVNTLKTNLENVLNILDVNNIKYIKQDWYQDALVIIENEELIRDLNIYKDGLIYLQSLSSMIPVVALSPKENENILDMTAAPGSKTSQIAALTNNMALITAVEKNKIRSERLRYNLDKLGVKKTNIIVKDATMLDDFYSFDKILLDAPCSGSGTLSINTLNDFSLELVNNSIKSQTKLLDKALKMLKKGETMVYSTCSILKEENEEIIRPFIEKNIVEVIKIDISNYDNIELLPSNIDGVNTIKPNKYYEGFFVAKLKKL